MIPSPRIGNIFFYVTDVDRTEAFYRDVIGLKVERVPDDGSGRPWLNAPIPGNVDLIFFHGEVRPGNSPILVFDLKGGGIDGVVAGLDDRDAGEPRAGRMVGGVCRSRRLYALALSDGGAAALKSAPSAPA
jgi:catechol 2,3-dioxygenase-like lactoylglutathione lyase family enzyme